MDVLSFRDYTATRVSVEEAYRTAEEIAKKYSKPILNTETACIARANPYDEVLQIAQEHHTGWYLFNLMIGGYWGEAPPQKCNLKVAGGKSAFLPAKTALAPAPPSGCP